MGTNYANTYYEMSNFLVGCNSKPKEIKLSYQLPLHESKPAIGDVDDQYKYEEMSSIIHKVLNSSSQSLDVGTRAFMEPRFGHDFSKVRVHADTKAAESARAVNALAYTVGNDVVFGAGQYQPATSNGRRLLGHELTHVVQQNKEIKKNMPIQRKVSYCCREIKTGKSVIDIISSIFGLEHCWLKTDTKTAGMGPAQEGPLPAWPFGIDTKVVDHSKEIAKKCEEILAVNEDCVNTALEIGKSTGKWSSSNNCNTFAQGVIHKCGSLTYKLTGDTEIRNAIIKADEVTIQKIPTNEKIRIINRLFNGWVSDADINIIERIYQNTPLDQRPYVKPVIEKRMLYLTNIGQRIKVNIILLK
jgi:hypothetical protein